MFLKQHFKQEMLAIDEDNQNIFPQNQGTSLQFSKTGRVDLPPSAASCKWKQYVVAVWQAEAVLQRQR